MVHFFESKPFSFLYNHLLLLFFFLLSYSENKLLSHIVVFYLYVLLINRLNKKIITMGLNLSGTIDRARHPERYPEKSKGPTFDPV
jgi:hypothetical protein